MARTGQVRKWTPAMLTREGNIASSAKETWAFYALAPKYIRDLDPGRVDSLIRDCADRVADLGGRRVWLRVTSQPWPVDDYRKRLAQPIGDLSPAPVPDAPNRADLIDAASRFPRDGVLTVRDGKPVEWMDSRWPLAVIGVRLWERPLERCDMRRVLADQPAPASRGAVEAVRAAYHDVTDAVARDGWDARPLDNDSMAWLYDSCLALGHDLDMQAPGDPSPLDGAIVRSVQDDDGTTVPVRVDIDGEVATRYCRFLRLESWHERDTTVVPPWLEWCTQQPYRVDVVALFDVVPPAEAVADVRRAVKHNAAIRAHYERFGREISHRLRETVRRGPELVDAMEGGTAAEGTQIHGQWVFAVSADTPQEAIDAAKRLRAHAARGRGGDDGRGPGMRLAAPPAQYPESRKMIPLEPWAMQGHPQRQSTLMLACGMPQATARAGDSVGAPFGRIAGSSDFYVFDWFGGPRSGRGGLWGVLGDQGAGKSSILAYAAWWTALVEQAPVTVLDPSHRLVEQMRMPELAPHVRHVRLDVEGAPGTLASHFITPDPIRDMYDTEKEWEDAMEAARTQRVDFAIDAARSALASPQLAADPDVMECLRTAITSVGGGYGIQPSEIVQAIERDGQTGARLARQIRAYAMMSGGRLLWSDRRDGDTHVRGGDEPVTVMSIAGVKPPRSADPTTWDTAESRAVMLLAGAAQLAAAHVWADRNPKALIVDEATGLFSGVTAFNGLMQRAALDSRKFTASIGVAMHLADTFATVGEHAASMFGAAFLMRTSTENAAAALPMLRASAGQGWEDTAPALDAGEVIVSGWDGKTCRTRFDQAWLPAETRAAMSTSTVQPVDQLRTLFGVGA